MVKSPGTKGARKQITNSWTLLMPAILNAFMKNIQTDLNHSTLA